MYILKIKIARHNTSDSFYDILFLMIWCSGILMDYLRAVILRVPILNMFPDGVMAFIYLFYVFASVSYIYVHIKGRDLLAYILVCLIYVFNIVFFENNKEYTIEYAFPFLLQCLPMIFIGLSLDYGRVAKRVYYLSMVSVIAIGIYKVIYGGGGVIYGTIGSEDMYSSYKLLPCLLVVMTEMFHLPRPSNVIVSFIGIILTFAFGTRGPLICIVIYITLYLFVFKEFKSRVFGKSVLIMISTFFVMFNNQIILFIQYIISKTGMSTRIIEKLLDRTFFSYMSGRDEILEYSLKAINEKPLLGHGFAGDRPLLGGQYAHNLGLELWISFGWIIGSLVLLWLGFVIVSGIRSSKDNRDKAFILILFSCSVIKLMMSGTYLNEIYLFLLVGFCLNRIRNKKTKSGLEKKI